jgi:hypothetical protein
VDARLERRAGDRVLSRRAGGAAVAGHRADSLRVGSVARRQLESPRMGAPLFHLAFPVHDLAAARGPGGLFLLCSPAGCPLS